MNKYNLKNHITLIGPSGIGKSLISEHLAKKTGLQKISLDEIISMINQPMKLTYNAKLDSKALKKAIISSKDYNAFKYNIFTAEYHKKKSILKQYIEHFETYHRLFGGLDLFRDYFYEVALLETANPSDECVVALRQFCDLKMTDLILSKIRKPVILDMPATFGYFLPENAPVQASNFSFNVSTLNMLMKNMMEDMGTIVLLQPKQGIQQISREPAVLTMQEHLDYYNTFKLAVDIDQLFDSSHQDKALFKNRYVYDAKSILLKNKLLDRKKIDAICSQILDICEKRNISALKF